MNTEQNSWRMVGGMAAAIALGAGAAAQHSMNGDHQVAEGRPVMEVSLEDDIRGPSAARGKIVLSRAEEREIQLSLRMRPYAGIDPKAIVPPLEEMDKALLLSEGTPGGMAVIHLDTRVPELRRSGGVRMVGQFDGDGVFEVDLPDDLPLRGLFAWAEEILDWDLVRAQAAGSAAQTSVRPIMEPMDLGEAAQVAYFNWVFYWTDLQLRDHARARGFEVEAESASLLATASSAVVAGARGKIVLERPRTPAIGGGHTLPGAGAEEVDDVVFPVDLQDPQGGLRAGDKIELQRPRTPGLGSGHTLPGAGAEEVDEIVFPSDRQDPQGGLRAGKKIELKRPSQRDNNVLRR